MTSQSLKIKVLISGCILKTMEFGIFKSLGVFFIPIQEALQTSNTVLGVWISMLGVAIDIFAPAAIFAGNTFGERPVIIFGGILTTASLCAAAFVTSVTLFGTLLFLAGTGICLSFFALMVIIPKYYPNNINNVFGFINGLGAIGMMVFPPVAQFLIQHYGWRNGMLLLGAFSANSIVCGLLIHPTTKHEQTEYTELNESSRNENMLNHVYTFLKDLINLCIYYPKFIIIVIIEILAGIIYTGWVVFLVPHAVSKGVSEQLAAFLSSSGAAGVIVGRLTMGPLIDSGFLTTMQLYLIYSTVNVIAFSLDMISANFILLAVNAFFNGLATGTLNVLSFGASAEVLGKELAVEGYGFATMFFPIGAVLGGAVLGHYFDKGSDMSFPFLGAVSFLMIIVISVSFLPCCGNPTQQDNQHRLR